MKTVYCPECEEKFKADIIQKEETYPVKGARISVRASVLVCSNCKSDLFDENLDAANVATAYNKYRSITK